MSVAYILTFDRRTGSAILEAHPSAELMREAYMGRPEGRGVVVVTETDLMVAKAKAEKLGQSLASKLLDSIDPDNLES